MVWSDSLYHAQVKTFILSNTRFIPWRLSSERDLRQLTKLSFVGLLRNAVQEDPPAEVAKSVLTSSKRRLCKSHYRWRHRRSVQPTFPSRCKSTRRCWLAGLRPWNRRQTIHADPVQNLPNLIPIYKERKCMACTFIYYIVLYSTYSWRNSG